MSRIRLRNCTVDDLDAFYAMEKDAEAARLANFPQRTRRAFNAHWTNKIIGDRSVLKRTVEVNGEVAGNIVCWDAEGERELGYWFDRRFWGRGIATAAVRAFVGQVEQRPLYAKAATANTGSVRLLEKCGFAVGEKFFAPDAYGTGEIEHVKAELS